MGETFEQRLPPGTPLPEVERFFESLGMHIVVPSRDRLMLDESKNEIMGEFPITFQGVVMWPEGAPPPAQSQQVFRVHITLDTNQCVKKALITITNQ
jgi:hypothetical protein